MNGPVARRQQGGFTLIEVVLAVAILALAMVTLSQTLGASALAYRSIDDTRRAYMVAADKLVEMQVYQQWPNTGTSDSTVTQGDREWWVRAKVSAGPYPDTRRVDIEVGELVDDQERDPMYTLASLIGKPAAENAQFQQPGGGGNAGGSQDLTGG